MVPPILYWSNHLLIIDKPAGLACHAGRGTLASVEDFFPQWRRGQDGPWLAHRLDGDTAGCLAIARRKTTLIALQKAFAEHRVSKSYWAVVEGEVVGDTGTVDLAIAKRTTAAGWKMVPDPRGEAAVTDWRVIGRAHGRTWLALSPRTGRTHQIRVHCAAIGHPVVGDTIYGAAGEGLCLLARRLVLPLETEVAVEAGVPGHMASIIDGWSLDRAID